MVTKKELYLTEALLLTTWFRIDAISSFTECKNVYTDISCGVFIMLTTFCFIWFLIKKRQWLWELIQTLWKSEAFDFMVTVAIFLPWLPNIVQIPNLEMYLSYASWTFAEIVIIFAMFMKDNSFDRTIK